MPAAAVWSILVMNVVGHDHHMLKFVLVACNSDFVAKSEESLCLNILSEIDET